MGKKSKHELNYHQCTSSQFLYSRNCFKTTFFIVRQFTQFVEILNEKKETEIVNLLKHDLTKIMPFCKDQWFCIFSPIYAKPLTTFYARKTFSIQGCRIIINAGRGVGILNSEEVVLPLISMEAFKLLFLDLRFLFTCLHIL